MRKKSFTLKWQETHFFPFNLQEKPDKKTPLFDKVNILYFVGDVTETLIICIIPSVKAKDFTKIYSELLFSNLFIEKILYL